MAAIEGFEVSLSAGDLVVAGGSVDGANVLGATLDGAALGDGVAYAVSTAGTLSIIEAANLAAGQTVVASCTIATGACTLESYAGRGTDVPVSANF